MAPERTGAADSRSGSRLNPADGFSGDSPPPPAAPQPPGQQSARPMDDDLTNLTWLQDSNLLQSIRPSGTRSTSDGGAGAPRDAGSETGGDTTDCSSEEGIVHDGASGTGSPGETYDPAVHVHAKPPYSFSSLIFMAVEDSPSRALPVKEIYSWILAHFPYFQNAPTGWKNSVRHNLSLNKCFLKVDKGQNVAKGSLWCIDPEYRPNLLLALRKTPPNPFHPIRLPEDVPTPPSSLSAFCLTMCSPAQKTASPVTPVSSSVSNLPNPDLFPYLSKRLAASATKELEVDAAATMLALKNAPRILSVPNVTAAPLDGACRRIMSTTKERRQKRIHNRTRDPTRGLNSQLHDRVLRCYPNLVPTVYVPVITVSPSEDHTYSSTSSPQHSDSPGSSIDEPFEFDQRRGTQHLPGGGGVEEGNTADSGGDSGVTRSSSSGGGGSTGDEMEELPYDDSDGGSLVADDEEEEQKKIVEGADALLNLAGIRTERGALEQHHQHQLLRTTRDRRKLGRHLTRHSRLEHVVQR